jgi:hypothetical protein
MSVFVMSVLVAVWRFVGRGEGFAYSFVIAVIGLSFGRGLGVRRMRRAFGVIVAVAGVCLGCAVTVAGG